MAVKNKMQTSSPPPSAQYTLLQQYLKVLFKSTTSYAQQTPDFGSARCHAWLTGGKEGD